MRRTIRSTFAIVASAAAVALGAGTASAAMHRHDDTRPAYFEMTDASHSVFVVRLTDPEQIRHARQLAAGETRYQPHVLGRIVKRPTDYNQPWSYHLSPDGVRFFDFSFGVCDATIPYVESHLGEAGDSFLPGLVWCDRTSRIVREVPAP
jgi:hypothetical protein